MRTHGKHAFHAAAAVTLAITLLGCLVPDNAHLMELNRSGKWREAERIGLDMLAHRGTFSHGQVCETFFQVAYAETRMGKTREAARLVSEFDAWRSTAPLEQELFWVDREMTALKDELGLLSPLQRTFVSAMEENGEGNYARARDLCLEVFDSPYANDILRASAHFVAAVCSIRLGDAESAEAHLAAYDSLKSSLPPGHRTLREEQYARNGLLALKP